MVINMRSITKLIWGLMLLFLILYPPLASGYAKIPVRWEPKEVVATVKGVAKYWATLLEELLKELTQTQKEEFTGGWRG